MGRIIMLEFVRTARSLALIVSLTLAACGGVSTSPETDASPDGGNDADQRPDGDSEGTLEPPLLDRPASGQCDPTRTYPDPIGTGEDDECTSHAECSDAVAGWCIRTSDRMNEIEAYRCFHDECFEDSDCAEGVCHCGEIVNYCVRSTCTIDADCGEGNYCAAQFDVDLCTDEVTFFACMDLNTASCSRPSDCAHLCTDGSCSGMAPTCLHDDDWTCGTQFTTVDCFDLVE